MYNTCLSFLLPNLCCHRLLYLKVTGSATNSHTITLDKNIAPVLAEICQIPSIAKTCGQELADVVVEELATVSREHDIYLALLSSVTGMSLYNIDEMSNSKTKVDDPFHM